MDVCIPPYEDPVLRFLALRGELTVARNGAAFNLAEALVNIPEEEFPLVVQGSAVFEDPESLQPRVMKMAPVVLTRDRLLFRAMEILEGGNGELFQSYQAQIGALVKEWSERTTWRPWDSALASEPTKSLPWAVELAKLGAPGSAGKKPKKGEPSP